MSAGVQQAPLQFSATSSQLAVAYSVCRSITRSAAKNFYYAFLVLPRAKREALYAVYAFMRGCDDIADDPAVPLQERRNKLAERLARLHRRLRPERRQLRQRFDEHEAHLGQGVRQQYDVDLFGEQRGRVSEFDRDGELLPRSGKVI